MTKQKGQKQGDGIKAEAQDSTQEQRSHAGEGQGIGSEENAPESQMLEPEKKRGPGRPKGSTDEWYRTKRSRDQMGKTAQKAFAQDLLEWKKIFWGEDVLKRAYELTAEDLERLEALAYAVATSFLLDMAGGLVPGSTSAQRTDAAKELRKGLQQASDAASRTLQDLGKDALREHLQDLRKTEKRIIQQEPEGQEPSTEPVLE